MSREQFEVAIIGAGIIGCSIADELHRRGWASILLLDRDRPGYGASRAALGGLPPSMEPAPNDRVAGLYRRSLLCYPAWVDGLKADTGIDPEFVVSGSLLVALRPEQCSVLDARYQWLMRAGWPAEKLSQDELSHLEPAFAHGLSALLMPEDARINNARLLDALVQRVKQSGILIRTGYPASLWIEGGVLKGVRFGAESIAARRIVNAAGAWAGGIGGPPLPIFAVRGQALSLLTPRLPSERMVASPDCYFVPRRDGSLILGSTVEPQIAEDVVTAAGIHQLLSAGRSLWPGLDQCRFLRAWAGLRPESSDHLPVLGSSPTLPNLVVATGFFKMGITLAPLAARLVADVLSGQALEAGLDILSPARFVGNG